MRPSPASPTSYGTLLKRPDQSPTGGLAMILDFVAWTSVIALLTLGAGILQGLGRVDKSWEVLVI